MRPQFQIQVYKTEAGGCINVMINKSEVKWSDVRINCKPLQQCTFNSQVCACVCTVMSTAARLQSNTCTQQHARSPTHVHSSMLAVRHIHSSMLTVWHISRLRFFLI
jgi:hypothetical protein